MTPSGALTIVAGTGRDGIPTAGPATSSDLGDVASVAADPAGDNIYLADPGNADVELVSF